MNDTLASSGHHTVRGLLTAEFRRCFLEAVRRDGTPPLDWIKGNAVSSRPFYELGALPAILDRLEPMLGPDIILWGALLVTRTPGQRHPWHTDIESSSPTGGMTSVWIGLENTTAASSLSVISGSHRFGVTVQEAARRHQAERSHCTDENVARWARDFAGDAFVERLELGDGDALFFDGRLWHGSFNTDPAAARTALLLQYARADTPVRMPDFASLDWPFRWLTAPQPPCVAVRGPGCPSVNRLLPPPSAAGDATPASLPRLTTRVQEFPLPLDPAPDPWRPHHLFAGRLAHVDALRCHVSGLRPGCSPHPPHRHAEEEILLMLAGEADLILPEWPAADGGVRHRLSRGQFAYYPGGFAHTLEAVGDRPANYLMLRWSGHLSGSPTPLRAALHDLELERSAAASTDTGEAPTRLLLEGPTGWLGQLHVHLSTRQPGAGYEPHVDEHDVILVTLEGEVETLGTTVGPNRVVVCAAGEPHGLRGAASGRARYVVFEMHGVSPTTPSPPAAIEGPVGDADAAAPQPLPLRVALSVLAHSAVFWLRGLRRRLRS